MRLDDEETCFCSPTLNVCLCKDILAGPATPKAYYHIAALAVLGLQFSPAALHPQSQQEPDQGELCRELGSNNINILLNRTDIPRTPADEPAAELTAVAPEAAVQIVSGEKMALVSFHRSLSSRTTDGAADCRAVGLDDVAVRPALVADQLILGRQLWLGRSVSPGSIVSQAQAR